MVIMNRQIILYIIENSFNRLDYSLKDLRTRISRINVEESIEFDSLRGET